MPSLLKPPTPGVAHKRVPASLRMLGAVPSPAPKPASSFAAGLLTHAPVRQRVVVLAVAVAVAAAAWVAARWWPGVPARQPADHALPSSTPAATHAAAAAAPVQHPQAGGALAPGHAAPALSQATPPAQVTSAPVLHAQVETLAAPPGLAVLPPPAAALDGHKPELSPEPVAPATVAPNMAASPQRAVASEQTHKPPRRLAQGGTASLAQQRRAASRAAVHQPAAGRAAAGRVAAAAAVPGRSGAGATQRPLKAGPEPRATGQATAVATAPPGSDPDAELIGALMTHLHRRPPSVPPGPAVQQQQRAPASARKMSAPLCPGATRQTEPRVKACRAAGCSRKRPAQGACQPASAVVAGLAPRLRR